MYDNNLECCAVVELAGLGDHSGPLTAMKDFCRRKESKYGKDKGTIHLDAFYIFTGVVRYAPIDDCGNDYTTYAPEFAEFIQEHKLGIVTRSVKRVNRNTDNTVQVWIWAPSVKNLNQWWKENRG